MTDKTTQGFVAGISSTILTHPLDTLKTYQQVTSRSFNRGIFNSIKTISQQGIIKGFYRGGLINCLSTGTFYGSFFPMYDVLKKQVNPYIDQNSLHGRFWCGYLAGLWGSLVSNPLYVLKIRQQSSVSTAPLTTPLTVPPTVPNLVKRIYLERGMKGFWSGYNLTIFRNLELGLQLPLYETLKSHDISPVHAGFIAKLISSSITYPFDTCRTLIRNGNGDSSFNISSHLLKTEGIRGFYRGYLFYAFRSVPASAITFGVYELFQRRC